MKSALRSAHEARVSNPVDVERQIKTFIAKFTPANAALIRAVRKALRARLRGAHELVYDNYNFFVIGFSPTERPSHAVVSLAADHKGVALCFLHGARLKDPKRMLKGSGNQVRSLRLSSAAVLREPALEALMKAAVAQGPAPFRGGKGEVTIRLISAKQRPRRKA